MSEELYNSNDYCKLAEQYEELKKENAELTADKAHLMNLFMESSEYIFDVVSNMKINDLERKCKALEADYVISNRELLILQQRIAELEEENETIISDYEERMDNLVNIGNETGRLLQADIGYLNAQLDIKNLTTETLQLRIAELEAAQRWIRTKVKLPDRAVRQFYEVVCLHQDFAELALFSKGRWIIYEGTSVYDITDRVVFWRRRQPLPAEVMDVLNKRQELQ